MSLLNRRLLMLGLPLVIAGCGFAPAYAPGGTGAALRAAVLVQEPSTQEGYLLTRHLETRLGRANAQRYALDLQIKTQRSGLDVAEDDDINRFGLRGQADYVLRDVVSGTVVTSGMVENFTAFSATGTTVATLAAERDAMERLMTILGDQIFARLLAADLPA
ncbi:LPS assembly lipoprotein LptE [Sulfitobacter sp. S190]|uniref:LPS assembly lipoprotein LptE n=1 Tax=Sulfitobacter sp. S190 TaxID=2867022 RepID=UPI0021A60534|nr:LPS assembly lipoprotein LptE [Sulfitobacter sp. S190]UWR22252.1 hypothetical protein K3756_16515 [Sulfitobacter sp. S190]